MANENNIPNTQEINSILAEAKKNRSQNQKNTSASSGEYTPKRAKAEQPQPAKTSSARSINDDFVVIDDDNDYVVIGEDGSIGQQSSKGAKLSKNTKKPKRKKTGLIVGLVIVAVLILAAGGAFAWYMTSGSTTFAKNVSVSGVSLAGMTVEEAKAALKPVEDRLSDEISITVNSGEDSITLTKEDFGYSFNTDDILKDASAYSAQKGLKQGEKTYTIEMTLDETSCEIAAEKAAEAFNADSKDAYVTTYDSSGSGTFTVEDEVIGKKIKTEDLAASIADTVKNGAVNASLDAPADEVKPKYTKDYLLSNIKKLSSFTTTSTNNENGNTNMRVSLGACNGSIIDPGEVWSFNACTGDSNLESNGYKPAGVIVEGRHETGVGGGICQSSTTIYNATLLCGMEVVERSCHYYKSVYVDAGRDATVDYGNLDLKMKNPFDTQLFMKCYMDGTVLHCEMYGVPQDDFDEVKISSETTSYFSTGYRVATSRTFYKDGKAAWTESLPNSTYYTVEPSSSSSSSSSSKPSSSSSKPSSSSSVSSSDSGSSTSSDSGSDDSGGSSTSSDAGSDDGGDSGDSGSDDGGDAAEE